MGTAAPKKKTNEKYARIIFCAVIYAVLAAFIAGLFIFNANYAKIYESPAPEIGKADFSATDLPSRDVACNLAGGWEFFYGKWIITDGFTGQPDGIINMPEPWSYKNFGNGRLPKTGYASYRLTAENIQSGVDITVYRHYANFAYRVFINGRLNYRSGELSKNAGETVITGKTDESHPYRTDGGPAEIVIEVSASNAGGFTAAPWLASVSGGISYGSGLRSTNYFALGITTAAVVVSVLSFIFFRYKRDITVPLFMTALYLHFLSSRDMLYVFGLQITTAMILELITALTAFAVLAVHFWRCGAVLKKPFVIISAAAGAVFTLLTIIFYGTPLAGVFAFATLAVGCAYLVPLAFNPKFTALQRCAYGALFAFLISVFCFELCDGLGLLVFGTEFIFTFELMLIICCFAALWLWKLAKTARNAIRVGELECELSAVKTNALKAQIKPHFIYNSLTAIQSRYRDGLDEGDAALERFARHLRLITDSDGEDAIPFDDEVRNVLNYFELENLRADGKLNLMLDLEFTDFKVPVLSLQPLVENAVKHGRLREKRDGYILLTSQKVGAEAVITVSDNGSGFDTEAVRGGVGIENTRKRFALMNAETEIRSEIGCGTEITVKIPLE